jgi:hypothetical protein
MPASDAQDLILTVSTPLHSQLCSATLNLPPLRLSEGQWVTAGTGEPVVLSIKLHRIEPIADANCPPEAAAVETTPLTGS